MASILLKDDVVVMVSHISTVKKSEKAATSFIHISTSSGDVVDLSYPSIEERDKKFDEIVDLMRKAA